LLKFLLNYLKGHVYGEKSMRKLAKNNEFVCPRTLTVYSLDDIQRVFLF